MSEGINWITIGSDEDAKAINMPRWRRVMGSDDNGVLFFPSSLTYASEQSVFMAAGYDGVPVAFHANGHPYFSGTWLAVNYPENARSHRRLMRGCPPKVSSPHDSGRRVVSDLAT